MTIPKVAVLTTIGAMAWILPAVYPTNKYLEGFSLTLAPTCLFAAGAAARHEATRARFAAREREQGLELIAAEREVAHQLALEERYRALYAPQPEEYSPQPLPQQPQEQGQLTGGHIHQPTLPTGAGRTQGAPAQRGPSTGENPGETGETLDRFTWETLEPLLLSYPAVLLVGAQGSGKTTMAQHLAAQKLRAGERVVVCDPHWKRGDWPQCEIVGKGKDYEAIDEFLAKLLQTVEERYEQRSTHGREDFRPITLICEELTQWGDRVPRSQEFILAAMSDFRKIAIRVIFLSHGKTNALMGGSKGTKATREATLATLELGVKLTRSGARPTGKAALSLPGMPDQVLEVPDLRTTPAAPPPAPVEVEVMDADDPSPTLTAIAREFAPMLEASLGEPDWVAPLREVCAQGGQCSVRDFQRCAWSRKAQFSADDCRGIFAVAERIEIGRCLRDGDGEIIGFSLSP